MLILASVAEGDVGQVTVLPAIFQEAIDCYRNSLLASLQNVKVFLLPFERDVTLEMNHAEKIFDEILSCEKHRGCFVVTPQHRNSLLLKLYETKRDPSKLRRERARHIIDESDAILDYNFQLVYALGEQMPLPEWHIRGIVLQGFLRLLTSECDELREIISQPTLVYQEQSDDGSFPKLRFLQPCRDREDELASILCKLLIKSPPYELRWMGMIDHNEQEKLISIISDPRHRSAEECIRENYTFERFSHDILAARGFIAYRVLFHCLYLCHRKNYGIGNSGKLMAVPYEASDTPKSRAEFRHPDIALSFTTLSYLHEGLTPEQLREAMTSLGLLGPSAQNEIYSRWINSIRKNVAPEDLQKFDSFLKVDVNNRLQFELVYSKLRLCMDVIFFWLNNHVFPTETFQFLENLASNAWNLVDSGPVMGFSGTDDNRFLLPRFVEQVVPEEASLRATKGEMIDKILKSTKKVHLIGSGQGGQQWTNILKECVDLGTDALIDVAGLMAGSSNFDVAERAARMMKKEFRGIVYFDSDSKQWNVYNRQTNYTEPLKRSYMKEAECFVYYDESRCRGSDMKLKSNAVALVTLEPRLTMARLLQGCARLRKLGPNGQKVILSGTSETLPSPNTTVREVLEKVLEVTVATTSAGVTPFFQRGKDYASFPEPQKSDVTLEQMYGGAVPHFEDMEEYFMSIKETSYPEKAPLFKELQNYCKGIKNSSHVSVGQLSAECEREIEQEKEVQQEEEKQVAKFEPYEEDSWEFAEAFSTPDLLIGTNLLDDKDDRRIFFPLSAFLDLNLSALAKIRWSNKLYCSRNFWATVQGYLNVKDISLFVRSVNPMLVLNDGRVVLISAYELDNLLPHWWKVSAADATSRKACIEHLYVVASPTCQGFSRSKAYVLPEVLTSIKLFRGYVNFSESERETLRDMLSGVSEQQDVLRALLSIRHRGSLFERSDLDKISYQNHVMMNRAPARDPPT